MAAKTNTKPANEVGIIGQMYENRKTKKVGVLESREVKYKTLMLRDTDGKTFNITFSTFKSDWRKYAGEQIAETSTQVEEKKAEQKEEVAKAKKEIKEKSEKVSISREDKVKAVHAVKQIISDAITSKIPEMRVDTCAKGGIKLHFKHKLLMEVWVRFNENRYTFCVNDSISERISDNPELEVTKNDTWTLKTKYRFAQDKIDDVLPVFVDALVEVSNIITEKENKKKKKNETNEEE